MYNGIKSRKAFCMNEVEAFANEVGMSYIFTHKNVFAIFRCGVYLSYIYLGSSVCHIPVVLSYSCLSLLRNAELFFMF